MRRMSPGTEMWPAMAEAEGSPIPLTPWMHAPGSPPLPEWPLAVPEPHLHHSLQEGDRCRDVGCLPHRSGPPGPGASPGEGMALGASVFGMLRRRDGAPGVKALRPACFGPPAAPTSPSLDAVGIHGWKRISHARWSDGSADDIDFDWRFAPNIGAEAGALMERAGKAWSRRLLDDVGSHTVRARTKLKIGDTRNVVLDEDVTTDGVLAFVVDKGPSSDNTSYGSSAEVDYTSDDFQSRAGAILLARVRHDSLPIMVHEIGHVLGIVTGKPHFAVVRYIDTDNHVFTGPNAMRANGGEPVPFQWLDADRRPVAPGTPGAKVEYDHVGVCTSIMAYCRDRSVVGPSELDFAILDDIGYELLDTQTAAEPERYGYGAWARHAAWGAGVERVLDGDSDRLIACAHVFGVQPAVSLAEHPTLTGSATWTGSLHGVDTADAALPPVSGDARLSIDLASLAGTVRFERLTVHRNGASRAFRAASLDYAGTVEGNRFTDAQERVSASFFGPSHEEMAGIVDDREVGLLGGFGG